MPSLNFSPPLKSPLNLRKRHYQTSNTSWSPCFDGLEPKKYDTCDFYYRRLRKKRRWRRDNNRPEQRGNHTVVLPTAPKEEEIKFGSSNTWGRNELKLLNVHVEWNRRIDLNDRVLKVKESEWSPELRARLDLFRLFF